jgi:ATP-binding cassette subfamily A (ABC1) protein 3
VIGAGAVDIFLWALIAGIVELWISEPRTGEGHAEHEPSRSFFTSLFGLGRRAPTTQSSPSSATADEPHIPITASTSHLPAAIILHNLTKTFSPAKRRAPRITAVKNLSLSIPSRGIFVLLGANGSGKSTTLEMVAGLERPTSGSIEFGGDEDELEDGERGNATGRPQMGAGRIPLGMVPQQNVLFPELTCYQTVRLWRDIKIPRASPSSTAIPLETTPESLEQLLNDCDLHAKMHSPAATLSGGQKRRLQLAAGLVGGSRILLVDEATSGVDPLSRRAIWRALMKVREGRCVVFTTHVGQIFFFFTLGG